MYFLLYLLRWCNATTPQMYIIIDILPSENIAKMISFFDRLDKFMSHRELNDNKLTVETGISNGLVGKARQRGKGLSQDNISKILCRYPELNADWLMTGRGSMLNDETIPASDEDGDYRAIPIVADISAAAGSGAFNHDHVEAESSIRLPRKLVRRGGTYHCVQVVGQSMAPTLQNGGYIISRLLDPEEWAHLKEQYIYVVTNKDGETFVKRVKNRLAQRGFIVCMSDNPDKAVYPNFDVMEEELHNIWEVEWYLSSKMPNVHDSYYSKLQDLEDNFEEFKATVLQELKKLY